MSFTVNDFEDLVRLLRERPEWQEQLRALVLPRELLELPALVRQLAERIDALALAQARTEQQLAGLVQEMTQLGKQIGLLTNKVGDYRGSYLEWRYDRRAGAYCSPFARRIRPVDFSDLADALEDAVQAGTIRPRERAAVLETDLVLSGRRREDQADIYVLVEVSSVIDTHDVYRAAERASALAKLGRPVIPVVAGEAIDPLAKDASAAEGVWQVLDGHVVSPSGEDGSDDASAGGSTSSS